MFVLFVMRSYLIEVRGLKLMVRYMMTIGMKSYLIEVRGLKPDIAKSHRDSLSRIL